MYPKNPEISVGMEMERLTWSSQTENFRRQRDFLKGSPKFPNAISTRKMYVPFAPCYFFQAFWLLSVPVEMSVKMEHAHPMEISVRPYLS